MRGMVQDVLTELCSMDEYVDSGLPKAKIVSAAKAAGVFEREEYKDHRAKLTQAMLSQEVLKSLDGLTFVDGKVSIG